jgi:hypothetical protein
MMTELKRRILETAGPESGTPADNSRKSILARGCDPQISQWASRHFPPLLGDPEYVPTTNDVDFLEKLESRTWSVVFFAPGACRFSAGQLPIPGGNAGTQGWTLEEYRELVRKHQGQAVQIVETVEEQKALELLKSALGLARETR